MAKKISRRDLGRGALAAAVTAGLAAAGRSQDPQKEPAQQTDFELELQQIEKQLARPLSPEARKIALQTMKDNHAAWEVARKYKLPENSEPCTVFVPSPKERRRP